jgi:hypothetical protein
VSLLGRKQHRTKLTVKPINFDGFKVIKRKHITVVADISDALQRRGALRKEKAEQIFSGNERSRSLGKKVRSIGSLSSPLEPGTRPATEDVLRISVSKVAK